MYCTVHTPSYPLSTVLYIEDEGLWGGHMYNYHNYVNKDLGSISLLPLVWRG